MATAFTHAIVAAGLTGLAPKPIAKLRLCLCLMLVAILPDADVIAFKLDIAYGDVWGHRGITHSLVFALLLALPLSYLLVARQYWWRWQQWLVLLLLFMATASHGVFDAMTNAGLGVGFYLPFENERYFFAWRPIIASTVNPLNFFNSTAWLILKTELLYIGLPSVVFYGVLYTVRYILSSTSIDANTPTTMTGDKQ